MKCPECGSGDRSEIICGYPGIIDDPDGKHKPRKIVLGGCIVSENPPPKWECNQCGHQWDKGSSIGSVYEDELRDLD